MEFLWTDFEKFFFIRLEIEQGTTGTQRGHSEKYYSFYIRPPYSRIRLQVQKLEKSLRVFFS